MVLLDLIGGVALLLWGLHMVLSGVLRAFGPDLRRFLATALRNRFSAFAAGFGLTALLQDRRAVSRYADLSAEAAVIASQLPSVCCCRSGRAASDARLGLQTDFLIATAALVRP